MHEQEQSVEETAVLPTDVITQTSPPALEKATFREQTVLLTIAGLSIVLDQWTKSIVELNIPLNSIMVPFPSLEPIIRFTHVANRGAAFGMFQNGSTLFMILAVLVSIGIIAYNFFALEGNQRLMRIALGLQMGGALGNFIDRVRIGHVTDFIDIGPWYIFNIADLSIVSGAVVLGYMVVQEMRAEQLQARAQRVQPSTSQQEVH